MRVENYHNRENSQSLSTNNSALKIETKESVCVLRLFKPCLLTLCLSGLRLHLGQFGFSTVLDRRLSWRFVIITWHEQLRGAQSRTLWFEIRHPLSISNLRDLKTTCAD